MPKLVSRIVSSLEKCLMSDDILTMPEKREFTIFKNERLSFQLIYRNEAEEQRVARGKIRFEGELSEHVSARQVVSVPVRFPVRYGNSVGEYISKEPGLYPDLLSPLHYDGSVTMPSFQLRSVWIDVEPDTEFEAGEYELALGIVDHNGDALASESVKITVVDAKLPEQRLIHTEWFYTDCIAQYYHEKPFSESNWKHIEAFMRTATKNGVNMIFTPVFTPELDTYVGGERLTTQLVGITVVKKNEYEFDFSKLRRWIDLALECGYKYFEIPHFFTQWGSKNAPKIVAKVNGRTKRIFGWETDAMGEEYGAFLSQFIPALVGEFKKRGLDRRCYFHVSDEPKLHQLEQYKRCKELISQYLEGYHIIDALSDYEFYKCGALEKPIPETKSITPFIENKVPGLWAYYCGSGGAESNRYYTMPTARTRIIGVQLYLYNIEGFLHWGYNFYNNQNSYDVIDPYCYSDGEYFAPSGDMYLVYPGSDGKAWESIRLNAMREAVDDIRALELYESKFGREATEKLVLEETDGSLTFSHYPTRADYLLGLRERIAKAFL